LDDPGVGLDQVIPAHPGFPRDSGGHHKHLGTGGHLIVVGSVDPGVVALDRSRLPLVEPLALRNPLGDVHHHHDTGEIFLGETLCGGRTDIARTHDGDLVEHSNSLG
jgi:hypothetical protein